MNKMKKRKFLYGIGVNDADYSTQPTGGLVVNGVHRRICPFYSTWKHMLERAYSIKFKEANPSYREVSVSEEWLTFSNFKAWMEKQDWEGKELDKDLLIYGNKVYSRETCVFVDRVVNTFLLDRGGARGDYPIGVVYIEKIGKFRARCKSIDNTGKDIHMGYFTDQYTAHRAWLSCKLEQAKLLAARQTDCRVAAALIARYENYPSLDKSEKETD